MKLLRCLGCSTQEIKECDYVGVHTESSKPGTRHDTDISADPTDGEASGATEGNTASGDRAAWGGKLEFLLTLIGYAVGLGNVWRFPYLCYKNGGGAFLLPYVLMLAVVGMPLFFLELSLGQFASLGPITLWKLNPLLKGLGYAMVAVSWLIALYYNVIIAHVLLYLFASLASIGRALPWSHCNNWWNTIHCYNPNIEDLSNSSLANSTISSSNMTLVNTSDSGSNNLRFTPSEEYYNNFVLDINGGMEEGGYINWKLCLCLLLAWLIVLGCLIRGIQSLGKVVYFTAIFPYIMLTILFVRGVTLPGAMVGIKYYLTPDFNRLADARVWADAATQIFYSLSACSGGLIAMASYNQFSSNVHRDSVVVPLINCGTSIYAGFVIFSILGFMATEKNVDVSEVATGGPGLAFVVYPEALVRMPASQLWAICFFIMMASLGFGSQFSIVECVLSSFTDEFGTILHKRRNSIIFRVIMIFIMFLLGLPMVTQSGIYLLDLVDYSVSGFPLLVVGFLEVVAVVYCYGYERFSSDINMMLGHRPNMYWQVCWKLVTPLIILVTIVVNVIFYKPPSYGESYHYPGWAQGLGWAITIFPFALIGGVFLWRFCRDGGFELMKELGRPSPGWGPAKAEDRQNTPYEDLEDVEPDFHNRITVLMATPHGSIVNLRHLDLAAADTENGLSVPDTYYLKTAEMKRVRSLVLSSLRDNYGRPLTRDRKALSTTQLDQVDAPKKFGSQDLLHYVLTPTRKLGGMLKGGRNRGSDTQLNRMSHSSSQSNLQAPTSSYMTRPDRSSESAV